MATTPLLLVTDVGLQVASVATPVGPFIHITGFKIGSAYGYDPQRTDTGLNGNILYAGQPIAYQNIGDNTINIVLRIPSDAGPFDFGEVGIFIGDNADTLFAKAVFESPQTKFSSLGTNLQSTYTFNCLLKLEQSVAVFKIDTENGIPPSIWEVDKWSDIYPPGVSANPDTPAVLCRELDIYNNSSLLHKADDENWTIGTNYERYGFRTIANGTLTSVQFPKTQFPNVDPTTAVNRQFVIKFADGFFRSVSGVISAGANWQFNLNPDPLLSLPVVGSTVTLYNNNGTSFQSLSDVPLMTTDVQGIARAERGIQIIQPGVIAVNGLNHDAPGTGRLLTSQDDLNDQSMLSGLYTVLPTVSGTPDNYPAVGAIDGVIYVVNTLTGTGNGVLTQTWYPSGLAGGTPDGKKAAPAYFRSLYDATNNLWTAWRRLSIGGGAGLGYDQSWVGSYSFNVTYPNDTGSPIQLAVSVGGNGLFPSLFYSYVYINGVQVNWGFGSYNNASNMSFNPIVPEGANFLVTYSGGGFLQLRVLRGS